VTPPPSESLDDLPLADLRRVVAAALAELERVGSDFSRMEAEVADLKVELAVKDAKIQEQAEEIARLKGLPARPPFKPSGMGKTTERAARDPGGLPRRRGAKRDTDRVTRERCFWQMRLQDRASRAMKPFWSVSWSCRPSLSAIGASGG